MDSFCVYKEGAIPSSSDREHHHKLIITTTTAINVPSNPQLQARQTQQAVFKS
jgi:hypothetical protein